MMIMINNINNKMVLTFSFFTPTQIQLRFIFFFGLLLSFGLGDLQSIDDIQQTDSNSKANGLSLSENEPIEKLPQVKNDQLDLLSGLSGINQNQNFNSNEDLLQTQNDQLDLLADLSGVKQKQNLPPPEKAKNPLDLLADSSGTHDTGTQLRDGVQQNPYQKAYPNSNLQPYVPSQKNTLDLLSGLSGINQYQNLQNTNWNSKSKLPLPAQPQNGHFDYITGVPGNEQLEKLQQAKNANVGLDLLSGTREKHLDALQSGLNQKVNSNLDLLQTQNDQLDLLADLSGVKQKENLPPPEKAKNPLDLLSGSSGTHDTGTQLQDGVQQNPYQKAYPNSNLQPSVPPQKHTLDLLSSSSGMRDNSMEFQQRSYQNANVEALPQPIQNNPYQGTQEPKTPILQPPRALSEYVLHQDFQEPALQHHEDLMARQLDGTDHLKSNEHPPSLGNSFNLLSAPTLDNKKTDPIAALNPNTHLEIQESNSQDSKNEGNPLQSIRQQVSNIRNDDDVEDTASSLLQNHKVNLLESNQKQEPHSMMTPGNKNSFPPVGKMGQAPNRLDLLRQLQPNNNNQQSNDLASNTLQNHKVDLLESNQKQEPHSMMTPGNKNSFPPVGKMGQAPNRLDLLRQLQPNNNNQQSNDLASNTLQNHKVDLLESNQKQEPHSMMTPGNKNSFPPVGKMGQAPNRLDLLRQLQPNNNNQQSDDLASNTLQNHKVDLLESNQKQEPHSMMTPGNKNSFPPVGKMGQAPNRLDLLRQLQPNNNNQQSDDLASNTLQNHKVDLLESNHSDNKWETESNINDLKNAVRPVWDKKNNDDDNDDKGYKNNNDIDGDGKDDGDVFGDDEKERDFKSNGGGYFNNRHGDSQLHRKDDAHSGSTFDQRNEDKHHYTDENVNNDLYDSDEDDDEERQNLGPGIDKDVVNNDFNEDGDDDDDDDEDYSVTGAPQYDKTTDYRYESNSVDTDNDRGLEETDEENDWYHNADNVRDDIDEKDFDDFGERQNNDDLYDNDDDDGYNDDANAHNTAVDPDNVDTEMWSRFESRDQDTDNDDNNEVLDHNNEYYRGRFPTEDILNNLEDEVKKTKPPTAPTNMVLFYTWMILVILIMVIVVSTYQAKCKGLLSNGNRQQMRAVGEDRKRLLDNEFV